MAEAAVQGVLGSAELFVKSARTDKRNSSRMAVGPPALPHQPHIKIEDSRRVCKCRDDFTLDGNSMLIDFAIEGFAQRNHVPAHGRHSMVLVVRIEPELHLIKKVEAMPVDESSVRGIIFSAEEYGRGEDAFKSFDDSAIVEAVELQAEKGEHLRGAFEATGPALLPQGQGCAPYGNEPVLAERQTKIRMRDDVEEEFAVASPMDELAGRRPAQRKPAQDDRARIESKLLFSASALLASETDESQTTAVYSHSHPVP